MRPSYIPGFLLILGLTAAPPAGAGQGTAQPDDAGYYFVLGRHLQSAGKIDDAITALKKAIELDPNSAEVRAELAGVYARQDRVKEALEAAEGAIERDPGNREANRILGSVYAALSDQRQPFRPGDDPAQYKNKAVAALEKSRRDSGFDLNLEFTLGRLYLQTGTYDKAVTSLRRVVDDQPGYPEAAMLLAAAQEGSGQAGDAVRTLELSMKENPEFFR
jgi:tetratricopeptide (TPR) repeat protein